MGTIAGNNDKNKPFGIEGKKKNVASSNMADMSNDPYFVKKAESAKRLLDKYGTPKNKK